MMITKLTTLDGITRKKDRSVTMRFTTCIEQTSEEYKILDMMFQEQVLIALKPNETPFLDGELEALDSVDMDLEDTSKTPSRRLRNVLYRLWEQSHSLHDSEVDFKDFYKSRMEALIEQIKNRLD